MTISAKEISLLRKRTGAGMMDCKHALIEASGDFDQAIDYLRKKGQKIALSRADRQALQGAIFVDVDPSHRQAALLMLNCETDFVAKNAHFLALGKKIIQTAMQHHPRSIEALYQLSMDDGTVHEILLSAISAIGEKLTLATYETLTGEVVVAYIHPGNALGVLVALEGANGQSVFEAGRDVAMQIAAMSPIAVHKKEVKSSIVERELAIIKEQVQAEGHTGTKAEKIIQGKLNKFFQENSLLEQPFIKNQQLTVGQYLQTIAPALTVTAFKRMAIGA